MFLNIHDAKMRLENTVVRHNKEPVHIKEVVQPRASYFLLLDYLRTGKHGKISLRDKALDLSPVPLGNMNHEGEVYYATRTPQRMWKQGLHRDNFLCRSRLHGYMGVSLTCKAIVNTINGTYPSIVKGHRMIEEGVMVGVAFSRHFSLLQDRVVVFNNKLSIGVLHKDLITFTLNNKYMYLKEHLQASIKGH